MEITKDTLKREAKFLAICLVVSIIQAYLMCPRCNSFQSYSLVTSFILLLYVFLWRGNAVLAHYLTEKISWIDFPVKRLLVGVALTIIFTLAAILLVMFVFENFLDLSFGSSYMFTILVAMLATFIISIFMHSKEFLFFWQKAALDAEKFQRESMAAKYENLKTQINPEFLFQSLHDLDSLVFQDEEKAVLFIKRLADVYRYILDTREREVVPVKEEALFLHNYFYLLRNRFGQLLNIQMDLSSENIYLPPLAIQMVIESNLANIEFNESNPLVILLTEENGRVKLTYNSQFKKPEAKARHLQVIEKIKDRFAFLSTRPFEMVEADTRFTILFPEIDAAYISAG
jgi:hypothetical protein